MSRFKILAANPRRSLAALATVLIAVGVTGASGADFNAQSANAGNTFASGALEMSNDAAPGAILSMSGMKPGDSVSGQVGIKNTGTVAGTFTLSKGTLTNSDNTNKMSDQINLLVKDCGADRVCDNADDVVAPVYNGTLTAMGTGLSLGSAWAGGAEHRYKFTATFNSAANDTYENASTTAQFVWNATS